MPDESEKYWVNLTDAEKIEALRRHTVELFHLIRARAPVDLIATPDPAPPAPRKAAFEPQPRKAGGTSGR